MSNPFNYFPPPFTRIPTVEDTKITWSKPLRNVAAEPANLGIQRLFTTSFEGYSPGNKDEVPKWYMSKTREPIHDHHAFFDHVDVPPLPVYQPFFQFTQQQSSHEVEPEPQIEPEPASLPEQSEPEQVPEKPKIKFNYLDFLRDFYIEEDDPNDNTDYAALLALQRQKERVNDETKISNVQSLNGIQALYKRIQSEDIKSLWDGPVESFSEKSQPEKKSLPKPESRGCPTPSSVRCILSKPIQDPKPTLGPEEISDDTIFDSIQEWHDKLKYRKNPILKPEPPKETFQQKLQRQMLVLIKQKGVRNIYRNNFHQIKKNKLQVAKKTLVDELIKKHQEVILNQNHKKLKSEKIRQYEEEKISRQLENLELQIPESEPVEADLGSSESKIVV